ncbi:multidrug resistance-associated protein 13, partial [Perilla frutescens var. hirtella]
MGGFDPLDWFCRPVAHGVWAQETDSGFGAFTPCAIDSVVGNVTHLVLLGLCSYRVWLINTNPKVQRYSLRSKFYNYVLAVLAGCCAAEPLFRFIIGISIFNLDFESGLAPFEMVHSGIEFISWCSVVVMLLVETKTYVKEFRWYIRFGLMYVLVGDAVIFNFIFPLRDFYAKSILCLFVSSVFFQVLLGVLLFAYVPKLESYPGYVPLSDSVDEANDEKPLGEQVCPERCANVFSGIYFHWMTPLMQQGYKRPITEKDVWKLDSWDQTETLSRKFQKSWEEEVQRSKPWLLRALNRSLGGRCTGMDVITDKSFSGILQIGNDLSQLAGPVILNHLLQSLERGDPAWVGYVYALSIFFSV